MEQIFSKSADALIGTGIIGILFVISVLAVIYLFKTIIKKTETYEINATLERKQLSEKIDFLNKANEDFRASIIQYLVTMNERLSDVLRENSEIIKDNQQIHREIIQKLSFVQCMRYGDNK